MSGLLGAGAAGPRGATRADDVRSRRRPCGWSQASRGSAGDDLRLAPPTRRGARVDAPPGPGRSARRPRPSRVPRWIECDPGDEKRVRRIRDPGSRWPPAAPGIPYAPGVRSSGDACQELEAGRGHAREVDDLAVRRAPPRRWPEGSTSPRAPHTPPDAPYAGSAASRTTRAQIARDAAETIRARDRLARADEEPPRSSDFGRRRCPPMDRSRSGERNELNRWSALRISRRPTSHTKGLKPRLVAHVTAHGLYAHPGASIGSVPPHLVRSSSSCSQHASPDVGDRPAAAECRIVLLSVYVSLAPDDRSISPPIRRDAADCSRSLPWPQHATPPTRAQPD